MVSTLLTRVEGHVVDVLSNLERVSLGGVALYAPEFHQVEYMLVKGFCGNLWEPNVRRKGVDFTTSWSYLALWRNPVLIVSASRRRPALNLSFVGWMM